MQEENKIPELEAVEVEEKGFDHDEHMDKVQEGLKQILASNDIDEIKSIAQSLLQEEEKEEEAEEGKEEVSMSDYMENK